MKESLNDLDLITTVVDSVIGQKLDQYLTRLEAYGFSGAMFVSVKNKLVLNKGYGYANRESKILNSPEIFYLISSISKHFTSTAILQLEMQDKLRVSDSIAKHLLGVPKDKERITLHHLMTHTSGLQDMHTEGDDFVKMSIDEAIETILGMDLLWESDNRFSYSNAGYILLAAVVELVSGISFVDYIKENLFKNAKMENSCFYRDEMLKEDNVSHGYNDGINEGSLFSVYGPTWALLGAGGVVSTLGDMYKWIQALNSNILLSDEAKKKLLTPHINNYGYGLDIVKSETGTIQIGHSGSNSLGFSSNMLWWPEEEIFVMVFFNQSFNMIPMTDFLGNKVSKPIFSDDYIIPSIVKEFDIHNAKDYVGQYKIDKENELLVEFKNEKLYITTTNPLSFHYLTNSHASDLISNELLHKKTDEIMKNLIDNDQSSEHMSSSITMPMMPVNFDDFRAFHFGFETLTNIKFIRNERKEITALEIYSDDKSLRVKKIN